MDINTQDLITCLKEPFPVADHKERKLPGGGRWFYIPWQTIRDRLEELFPLDWTVSYSDPVIAGDYTVIRCQLTVLLSQGGITREGVGNDKAFPELNQQGKTKTIGTPPERARADAFKNAAEEFGIGAYLDDQKFVIRHMQTLGDSRAYKFAKENDWLEHGLPTAKEGVTSTATAQEAPGSLESLPRPTARVQPLTPTVAPDASDRPEVDGSTDVLAQTSVELKRVGWTADQGRDYLVRNYGKRSRQQLTESELWDFLIHLRSCSPARVVSG